MLSESLGYHLKKLLKTEIAASVSTSMDNFCLFTSNITDMGSDDLLPTLNNGVDISSGIGSYSVNLLRLSHI